MNWIFINMSIYSRENLVDILASLPFINMDLTSGSITCEFLKTMKEDEPDSSNQGWRQSLVRVFI